MPTISPERSILLVIDLQARLVPAIAEHAVMVANSRRLVDAASLFKVPVLFTEQNPAKLGGTVAELAAGHPVLPKMGFSATDAAGFAAARGGRPDVVLAGCEAHVCVLQTALALLAECCRVFVVLDAIGSRAAGSKEAAVRRMERHGAEVVTTEMVIFEWLGTAAHPRFREAVALVK